MHLLISGQNRTNYHFFQFFFFLLDVPPPPQDLYSKYYVENRDRLGIIEFGVL